MPTSKPYLVVITKTVKPTKAVFIVNASDKDEAEDIARHMVEVGDVELPTGEVIFACTKLEAVETEV